MLAGKPYIASASGRFYMQVHLLKSKIHRAQVTESSLDYEGSLTIDADLLDHPQVRCGLYFLKIDSMRGGRIADREFGRINR